MMTMSVLIRNLLTAAKYSFCMTKSFCGHLEECFAAINKLRKNTDIVITNPDKGSGVVILNKCDYIKKMENISANRTIFKRIGPAFRCNYISGNYIDSLLHKSLLELFRADLSYKNVYQLIRPTGA